MGRDGRIGRNGERLKVWEWMGRDGRIRSGWGEKFK